MKIAHMFLMLSGVVMLLGLGFGASGFGLAAPAPSPTATPTAGPSPSPAASPSPGAAGEAMVATVSGGPGQEVPPIANPPRGAEVRGAVVLSANRQQLGFTFGYDDLSGPANAGHFHRGTPTEAGMVVQTICGAPAPALSGACPTGNNGVVAGVWNIPQNLLADLLAGRIYVNFHTAANPGGEVRGNITISR